MSVARLLCVESKLRLSTRRLINNMWPRLALCRDGLEVNVSRYEATCPVRSSALQLFSGSGVDDSTHSEILSYCRAIKKCRLKNPSGTEALMFGALCAF